MFHYYRDERARGYASDCGALSDIQTIAAEMDTKGVLTKWDSVPTLTSFQRIFSQETQKKKLSWGVKYELDKLLRTRGRVGVLFDIVLLLPKSWNSNLKDELRIMGAPLAYIDKLAGQLFLPEHPKRFVDEKKGKLLMIALRDSVSSRAMFVQQSLQQEVREKAKQGDKFAVGLNNLLRTSNVMELFSAYDQKDVAQDEVAAMQRCEILYPRLCEDNGPIVGNGRLEDVLPLLHSPMTKVLFATILECIYPQD
jgi:hypothetical protein